jgi:ectoine hydroxylase-related dioxygenase (phytanoyl-CoA dioxygenase family)
LLGTGLSVAVEVDESQAVDVRLAAGAMSLHHVDIIHGSGPNRSDGPRIGFAIRFTSPDVTQQRPHHDVVLARGADRRGHFSLRTTPPEGSIEDGLVAQETLVRRSAQRPSSRRAEK